MRTSTIAVALLLGCGGNANTVAAPVAKATGPVPSCPTTIAAVTGAADPGAFEGNEVVRVCVVGANEASLARVEHAVLHAGDRLTSTRVRADLQAVLELGFDDVTAYALPTPGGSVVLMYAVRPRPIIADIAVDGPNADASLGAKVDALKGRPYEPAAVNKLAQSAREAWNLRGYAACKVSQAADRSPGDQVRVRIKVEQGPLFRIAKIDFRGNKRISSAELLRASGLNVADPYADLTVERAASLVSRLYEDRGFVEQRVTVEQDRSTSPSRGLTFAIDEGESFTLGALHVTKLGAPVEAETDLLKMVVHARPKQVFSVTALAEDTDRLKNYFAERSQRVSIEPKTKLDRAKKTAAVTFEVQPE